MNTGAALQQPKLVPVWTPAQPEPMDLYTVKVTDPDTGRETVCLYSSREPGRDLVELFVKRADRKGTTSKGYTTYIRQFAKWLDDHGITQPVFDDVQTYRDDLADRGLSAGTQAQYIRGVKMFFSWTARAAIYPDVADDIRGAKVRHDVPRRDALTMDEAETVRRSIDRTTLNGKRLYAMYMLAVRRGLRVVEISRASVKDLNEKNGVLSIVIWGKGHDEPDVERVLDNDTRDAIADYLDARGPYEKTDPLFVSTSNNSKGDRIAATTIGTMLKTALVEAGFNSARITAHSLRHTAITAAVKCSGGNIHRGKDFARHADPATTEGYTHTDTIADDAELVRTIERKYHGDVQTDQLDQARRILDTLDADQLEKAIEYMNTL